LLFGRIVLFFANRIFLRSGALSLFGGGLQTISFVNGSHQKLPSSLGHFPLALLAILFNNAMS